MIPAAYQGQLTKPLPKQHAAVLHRKCHRDAYQEIPAGDKVPQLWKLPHPVFPWEFSHLGTPHTSLHGQFFSQKGFEDSEEDGPAFHEGAHLPDRQSANRISASR